MFSRLMDGDIPRARHLSVLWGFGTVALVAVTAICFPAGLSAETAAFAYLVVIVLLSLFDSFVSSAIFSVVAVGLLDFFFIEPLFTFSVESAEDILTLASFVGTSLVITGLVRRMRNLAATHREQARLLNLTHDSVIVRDQNKVITYWNRGAQELYGWTSEEAIGQTAYILMNTQFPLPRDELTQILLDQGRWEGELIRTTKYGAKVVVTSRWAQQRDSSGRPTETLETSTDITERRRAEEALRRSQAAYLAEAQKLSATGSFSWNAETDAIFWSDESFRIFGYDPATDPSIALVFDRTHPDDRAHVQSELDGAKRRRKGFDFEHRLLMPDGSVKHLHVLANLLDDTAETLLFIGAMMDVTEAKRRQEQLHEAQAELAYITRITTLGELAASIAHEVNQPLAAIVTSADASLRFLALNPPQLDEVRSAVKRIAGDGKRAAEIVQRIRGLTKKTQPQSFPLDVNCVIREGISLVQREVISHRATLHADLADGLPEVLGDKVQLQQVIINLIVNGIQAVAVTENRPRELIIRSARDDAGLVAVSVEDTGTGIDPANAGRLFDAFFTTKPEGMGMGLSICRTIIEAHGGRVWASDNARGGATFHFSLPAAGETAT